MTESKTNGKSTQALLDEHKLTVREQLSLMRQYMVERFDMMEKRLDGFFGSVEKMSSKVESLDVRITPNLSLIHISEPTRPY